MLVNEGGRGLNERWTEKMLIMDLSSDDRSRNTRKNGKDQGLHRLSHTCASVGIKYHDR